MRFAALVFTILLASIGLAQRVLFIGNSYTFYNNLPLVLTKLGESAGEKITVDRYTPGGYRWSQHLADSTKDGNKLVDLLAKDWDYVVVQQQSTSLAVSEERRKLSVDSIVALAKKFKGAKILVYGTWGRRDGLQGSLNSYTKMQNELDIGFSRVVKALKSEGHNTTLVPVGTAFRSLWIKPDGGEAFRALYHPDGSHPGPEGTYLAASMFYAALGKDLTKANYVAKDVTPARAKELRKLASDTFRAAKSAGSRT